MRMKHSLLNMLVATIPSLILPIVGFVKFSLFFGYIWWFD